MAFIDFSKKDKSIYGETNVEKINMIMQREIMIENFFFSNKIFSAAVIYW